MARQGPDLMRFMAIISANRAGAMNPLPQAASNSAVTPDAAISSTFLPSLTILRMRAVTVASMSR